MSYIDKDLLDGERIVYRGKLHWLIFAPSVFWVLVAITLTVLSHSQPMLSIVSVVVVLYAVYVIAKAFIVRMSTELAVTNKRVILKQGLISRQTMELNHTKIESIREEQSVMDRLFDCGTVVIEGTGGGKEFLRNIDAPLTFKKQAQSAADAANVRQ